MIRITMVVSSLSSYCRSMLSDMVSSIPNGSFEIDDIPNNHITLYTSGDEKLIINTINDNAILTTSSAEYGFYFIKSLHDNGFIANYIIPILNSGGESVNTMTFVFDSDEDYIESINEFCKIAAEFGVNVSLKYSNSSESYGFKELGPGSSDANDKSISETKSLIIVNMYKNGE